MRQTLSTFCRLNLVSFGMPIPGIQSHWTAGRLLFDLLHKAIRGSDLTRQPWKKWHRYERSMSILDSKSWKSWNVLIFLDFALAQRCFFTASKTRSEPLSRFYGAMQSLKLMQMFVELTCAPLPGNLGSSCQITSNPLFLLWHSLPCEDNALQCLHSFPFAQHRPHRVAWYSVGKDLDKFYFSQARPPARHQRTVMMTTEFVWHAMRRSPLKRQLKSNVLILYLIFLCSLRLMPFRVTDYLAWIHEPSS